MATQLEDDVIDNEPEEIVEPDDDGGDAHEPEPEHESGEAEEVDVVSWGDDAVATEDEPEGMRNLRARLREVERENKQLKTPAKADQVGPEPDMDDYWDKPEQYKTDLLAWNERRRKADDAETQQQAQARKQQERWEAQHRDLNAGYGDLRAPGKDAARSTVEDAFPGEQFAFLVKAAGKNAPAFVLALGNASEKRSELQALWNDGHVAEFIAAAAVMAREVNVQRKPRTTPIENHAARGASGAGASGGSKTLERLEAEADRTGDRSKVVAYKRQLKEMGK